MSSGPTYPLVKHSSSAPPATGLPAVATYASSVASTGVEHGEAANAKVRPARYACQRILMKLGQVYGKSHSQGQRWGADKVSGCWTTAHNQKCCVLREHNRQVA